MVIEGGALGGHHLGRDPDRVTGPGLTDQYALGPARSDRGGGDAAEADADPAYTDEFTVTGFYVEDVWYPKTSKSWGNRPEPDSLVSLEQLEIEFLPWKRPSKPYPDKDGKYVLILPALPPVT